MRHRFGSSWAPVMIVVGLMTSSALQGQQAVSAPISDIRYAVRFDSSTATRDAIEVTMRFAVASDAPVVLSLPAWTPGSYELDHFARYVDRFSAAGENGPVPWARVDFDTWEISPGVSQQVSVTFEFRSDTLDTGMSYVAPEFAFFNGANLFLFPQGAGYDFPSRVEITTEPGWLVATGLRQAPEGGYQAGDYHELVDQPTFVGRFDLDSMEVDGVNFRLASYPQGVLAGAQRDTTWDHLKRMIPPMAAVFGEVPFPDYTVLMAFDDGYPGAGALEHGRSYLGIYHSQFVGNWVLSLVSAHEIFHAWNVKRLRPEELVPYVYDQPQPTKMLWVSEGITDYYADLVLVRSGIIGPERFYDITAGKVGSVENAGAISLEDASLATWTEPIDGSFFLYYPKGSIAGLLLDILIRDATDNERSLDDVMQDLYRRTYQRNRGFNHIDLWQSVGRMTNRRSFADFYSAYIKGRDRYPWSEVLPLAGLRLEQDTVAVPRMGINSRTEDDRVIVTGVTAGGSAAEAGVRVGDVLLRAGEVEVSGDDFGQDFRSRYAQVPSGTAISYQVSRDGAELALAGTLTHAKQVRRRIVELAGADPKAVRITNGILTGTRD